MSSTAARVTLRDLTIAHGHARLGGAIRVGRLGRLSLRGSTAVINSDAEHGGGIFGFDATVRLHDTSSVAGNEAEFTGGGINAGTVILNDDAVVVNNLARSGGGIVGTSDVVLNGSAHVMDNTALFTEGGGNAGGGIVGKRVTLNDSAAVSGNVAEGGGGSGGGIYAYAVVRLRDSASVYSNAANDGGGISAYKRGVILRGSSIVSGNDATSAGGGIATFVSFGIAAPVWLYGTSSVVGNMAVEGGGISAVGPVYICSDQAAISPNDPDDPPPTTPCP